MGQVAVVLGQVRQPLLGHQGGKGNRVALGLFPQTPVDAAKKIDGIVGPRIPACMAQGDPNVGWLFEDTVAAATDYYKRTGIFPIMHVLGIRKDLVEKHAWLPATVYKGFELAKAAAIAKLSDTSATKVTLPFVEEQVRAARALMGRDFWSYGLNNANRKTLDTFLRHHHAQGLSSRRVTPEELFHPSTLEAFKI